MFIRHELRLFPVLLVETSAVFSNTSGDFSHMHAHSSLLAEYLKGLPAYLWGSPSAVFSSLVSWPIKCSCVGLLRVYVLKFVLFTWGCLPSWTSAPLYCSAAWKVSQSSKLGQLHCLSCLFPINFSDLCTFLPDVQCLEKRFLHMFFPYYICLPGRWRDLVLATAFKPQVEVSSDIWL